jgi:hypothetical protein
MSLDRYPMALIAARARSISASLLTMPAEKRMQGLP